MENFTKLKIRPGEIHELTEAIKNSSNLSEFFLKAAQFLKEHCKKINFVWQKNEKIIETKKVGRHKIEEVLLKEFPPPPEKYLVFDLLSSPKAVLYTRPKRKTTPRKLKEIIDVISCGVHAVAEREKIREIQNSKEKIAKELMELSEKTLATMKETSVYDKLDEVYFEKIAKKISESFGVSTAIVIEQIGIRISIPESLSFENDLFAILSQIRNNPEKIQEIKDEIIKSKNMLIEPIKKSENFIGIIGIKSEKPISEEEKYFLENVLNFIILTLERREKLSAREKFSMIDILNRLNTGIAFFSKTSPRKPIFSNEKFEEYIRKYPEIISSSESEIISSSVFNISSMRELKIGDDTLYISVSPIYEEGEIMVEIIKETRRKPPIEDIVKEFQNIISEGIEACENQEEKKPGFERIKSKTKLLLSIFGDTTESLSKILDEIATTDGIELERNISKDITVPYNSLSSVLKTFIYNIKTFQQKVPKIQVEEQNSSVIIKIPYRSEDKKLEDDVKFIMKYFKNMIDIDINQARREIKIKIHG